MDEDLAGLRFEIEDVEPDGRGPGPGPGAAGMPGMGRGGRRGGAGRGTNAVCIHYLVGMCALDKECPFLHQYDYDKIPICPYGSKCIRDVDCPYKHVSEEDKVECVFFRQGFCMYGPFCRYRHVHRNPEECPEEADFNLQQRDAEDPPSSRHHGPSHSHSHGPSPLSLADSGLGSGSGGGMHHGHGHGGPSPLNGHGQGHSLSSSQGGAPYASGGQQPASAARGGVGRRRPGGALERNENYKTTLCNHWRDNKGMCPFGDDCVFAHGEAELRKHPLAIAREQAAARRGLAAASVPPGPPIPAPHEVHFAELGAPLQDDWRIRYFVIKSLNYKNLAQSVRRGLWRTHRNNERLLNESFRSTDKVVLFFSVNESGHWQGVATMASPIRNQQMGMGMGAMHHMLPPNHPQDGWTAEMAVEWLRLVSLPFPHTRPLRNPLNENLPISRSRDCQELTSEIGRQLLYLMYNSPEQPLTMPGYSSPNPQGSPLSIGGLSPNSMALDGQGPHPMDPLLLEGAGSYGSPSGGGLATSMSNAPHTHASGKDFPIFPGPAFLFSASTEYLEECLGRGLFGLPAGGALEEQVKEVVVPGTTLFVLNPSNRTVLGIFEAASPVGYNLEAQAWSRGPQGGTSPYPLQVRFRCLLEAPPVSEADPEVRSVLASMAQPAKGMGGGRAGALTDDQAQRLANILASRAGVLGLPASALGLTMGANGRQAKPPSPIMRPTPRLVEPLSVSSSSSMGQSHGHRGMGGAPHLASASPSPALPPMYAPPRPSASWRPF